MSKKAEKPLNRKALRAAVGITHDPLGLRLEEGDPIPDKVPDKDLRPLVAGGAVVEVEDSTENTDQKGGK